MTRFLAWVWHQPYLLLTVTSLFWAGNAVVGRFLAGSIPPATLAGTRWLGAFVLLLPLAVGQIRRDWQTLRHHMPYLVLVSFAGITVFNTLLYWSLQHTTAMNASLMQSTAPLLIGVWTFLLFRDRLTGKQIAGILTSLFGVLVIVTEGDLGRVRDLAFNAGDVMVVAAMTVYAFYSALLRKRPVVGALTFVTVTIGIGTVLLLPFSLHEVLAQGRPVEVSPASAMAVLYVILFPSVAAYLFFNRGVELIGANRAGPFFHLVPLFGTALAILLLGERPALFHAVGAGLILAGVFVATKNPAAPKAPAASGR